MSLPDIAPIKDESVAIQTRGQGVATAVVELTGVLNHRDPAALLAPFFDQLHRAMVGQGRTLVRMDLRGLRFMNSVSFKYFITWIRANGAMPAHQRYRIHFLVNPKHHWQRVSIHALSCFSLDAITVEELEAQ